MQLFANRLIAPWHVMVDATKFGPVVGRLSRLGIAAIASAHGPATHGAMVQEAIQLARTIAHRGGRLGLRPRTSAPHAGGT